MSALEKVLIIHSEKASVYERERHPPREGDCQCLLGADECLLRGN